MSDKTKIEWSDATWNPVTGCDEVSPGCDHCYAKTFAERWRGTPGHHFEQGFDVVLRPERLDQPLRWRKPRRIFVNSMSDLFHKDIPDEYIARVFAVMAMAGRHAFQVLTKRHGRMRSLLNSDFRDQVTEEITELIGSGYVPDLGATEFAGKTSAGNLWGPQRWPLPNVWLGVSVENQQWADIRIPALLETPAAVRFLSCEPLLGPVDMRWRVGVPKAGGPRIHWVIVGGESGRGARPMHPDWARSLRDQCTAAGIPLLFKQWGEWRWVREAEDVAYERAHGDLFPQPWECIDRDGQLIESGVPLPGGAVVQKVGKKAAGRELDGRTWDEFPEAVTVP